MLKLANPKRNCHGPWVGLGIRGELEGTFEATATGPLEEIAQASSSSIQEYWALSVRNPES